MATISAISGIAALAARYDGFVLDIWGVLHDGRQPYPGVLDCLARLRAAGKRTCLLSNAPRRNETVIGSLARLGIARNCYDEVYTSGEAVYEHLRDRPDDWHRRLGRRIYQMGPQGDASVYRDLHYDLVAAPEEADFVIATGIASADETLALYEPALQRCAAAHLPMICANPDLVVNAGRRLAICAGTMAARYEELGGDVRYHGKPHRPVYDRCRAILAIADASRVVCIGDSLRTDVAGANGAGLDAAIVTSGIHREEFHVADGEAVDAQRLAELATESGFVPTYAVTSLAW